MFAEIKSVSCVQEYLHSAAVHGRHMPHIRTSSLCIVRRRTLCSLSPLTASCGQAHSQTTYVSSFPSTWRRSDQRARVVCSKASKACRAHFIFRRGVYNVLAMHLQINGLAANHVTLQIFCPRRSECQACGICSLHLCHLAARDSWLSITCNV